MRSKKSRRPIIAVDDVSAIFDDACVAGLAEIALLPPSAGRAAFADAIREAARIFARDARIPTGNELHDEISQLLKAAERKRYDQVAALREGLSPRAGDLLQDRGDRIGIELPPAGELLNPERRNDACQAIARLCQFGGQQVEGRLRRSGKQSRPVWRPVLNAPEKQRNFARRNAELYFVQMLSTAWLEAVGSPPARTARHGDASRDLGPFARLVRKCLDLVGAWDADAVELINEVDRRRDEMERRSLERGPK